MTKMQWLFAGLLAVALVVHALVPRYEWRDPGGDDPSIFIRIDRWTGRAESGQFLHVEGLSAGEFVSFDDLRRYASAGRKVSAPGAEATAAFARQRIINDRVNAHPRGIVGVVDEVLKESNDAARATTAK